MNDLYLDKSIIETLINQAEEILENHRDEKIIELRQIVKDKIKNTPVNEGNKKILIFSAFADTANYLYDSISEELLKQGYYTGIVSGSDKPRTTIPQKYKPTKPNGKQLDFDFNKVLTFFSPLSKNGNVPEDRQITVLIGTDCISEGQNLQDCDTVISYDIQWNPVNLIQRFGRIDRIGSRNTQIKLINFFPAMDLNEVLTLADMDSSIPDKDRIDFTKGYTDIDVWWPVKLVKDKNYFVLTTNADHQFQMAGFDKERLFYTQGDYGLFQCSVPCHNKTYDNEDTIIEMIERQEDMKVPTELIPRCPVCSKPMTMNLRSDDKFVEDEGRHEAAERYNNFVAENKDKNVVYLELGVGGNTPVIIKYPFWQLTAQNENASYICVNLGECYWPDEIADQSVCINADIGKVIEDLN